MRTLLASLLMPPTGLVLLAVAGLLLAAPWQSLPVSARTRAGTPPTAIRAVQRFGYWLSAAALFLLLLLGMPAVASALLIPLERDLPTTPPPTQPPQAIIVLGAEIIDARQEPLGARPGLLTLDRLRTAAALHRRTGLPLLVSGGTTETDRVPVALIMQQSLTDDFGTPPHWVEPRSADTWQNARFSAAILLPQGVRSVYVVTQAWHMRRSLLAFRGTGLTVTAAPTPPDDPTKLDVGDFVPRVGGWLATYWALHEWVGYAWYRLR